MACLIHRARWIPPLLMALVAGSATGAGAITLVFEPVTCGNPPPNCIQASYTENGVTVVSLAFDGHVHLGDNDGNGSPDLMLHATGNASPYRFTYSGGAFTPAQFDFVFQGGTHTFTSSTGAILGPTASGIVTFPATGWTGITSFTWADDGTDINQRGVMDNFQFCPGDCSDGNACTTDACDPGDPGADGNGCTHVPNTGPCDDGNFCNGTDTCSGGSCSVHAGDPCTTGAECANTCNEAADNCLALASTPCTPDSNTCTDDVCNGTGACTHPMKQDGESCDDGDSCTTGDTCSGGTCSGTPSSQVCNDGNPCTLDECDPQGGCIFDAAGRDGFACDDTNPCSMQDVCMNGVCRGTLVEADTDGDGFCDRVENDAGCNPNDPFEIPPRPNVFAGAPGVGPGEVDLTYATPGAERVPMADPTCASAGVCGPIGFCTAGRIWDPCETNTDCDLPPNTCRIVVNFANLPDLTLVYAKVRRTVVGTFAPATPGCSRKVDVPIDPARLSTPVRLKATATVGTRRTRDTDRFRFRNF
jgi:hypothetical protein